MLELIQSKLLSWGLHESFAPGIAYLVLVVGVLIVALLSDWITRIFLLRFLRRVIKKTKVRWDDVAFKQKVFHRLSHLAPAIVISLAAPLFATPEYAWSESLSNFLQRAAMVYMVIVVLLVVDALLNTVLYLYRNLQVSKQRSIRSYVQLAKIIILLVGGILALSIVLNKSPWAFLTGLSAMAAVLMLVFKDSILGFVASVQVSAYDMIRPGDWIELPKYGVDGDVIEISLNVIKVQNWDKTIVTVPMSALLSESVKNWRGMSESGGRRIKRNIKIDMNTIKFCDEEMLKRFAKIQFIQEYLENKRSEIQEHNTEHQVDTSTLVNGRHLTNVGTFRAYVEAYLHQHGKIHQNMTFLIRQLQPDAEGLPIEIYVFTNDTRWVQYEAIQADIFDHILAVVPLFDLAVFQNTSGQNYKIDIVSMPQGSN